MSAAGKCDGTAYDNKQAHLGRRAGNMAKALMSRVDEMLAKPPSVEAVDIQGMKNQLA